MTYEAFATSFSLGLLATANPCILPLYPGFLAYLAGGQVGAGGRGRYALGALVLAGVLTMMLALGLLIALLSVSIGSVLIVAVPLADLVIVTLGVLLLAGVNPFKALPQVRSPLLSNRYLNAFVYGLLYGPITLPCSGPLVVSIFALSFAAGQAFNQFLAFVWFGLGFGVPLLVLSFLSGAAQRWLTRQFAVHARPITAVGGLLLVGLGVYDLILNWDLITTFIR